MLAYMILRPRISERGANAIIGMRFDTSAPIGSSHIEVLVYGTAVNIKRDNGKHQYHDYDDGKKHVSFKDVSVWLACSDNTQNT